MADKSDKAFYLIRRKTLVAFSSAMFNETEKFELKKFAGFECSNGVARKGDPKFSSWYLRKMTLFSLDIYPNGNGPRNADYVSITFDKSDSEKWDDQFCEYTSVSFQVILSVVDANRNLRFSQSFGMELEESTSSILPIHIDRFVRRSVLLDASEELLPGDTLTLLCEFFVIFSEINIEIRDRRLFKEYQCDVARDESWFIESEESMSKRIDLRNADSPLCTRLRQESAFFDGLFRSACQETQDGYMTIEGNEIAAFESMLYYIRFGNLLHVDDFDSLCDVYRMARVYGVPELEEECAYRFREYEKSREVLEVLRIAQSRDDADLRRLAFLKILVRWEEVRFSPSWHDFCSEWPQLANELSCAASHFLYFERGAALSHLAAEQVFLNSQKLQHSPAWPIFIKKLPNLAILFRTENTNEAKPKPLEKYKDHALEYDFYR